MKSSPKIELVVVINLVVFTLLIGANHVVTDLLILGHNKGLQYDITLFGLLISHLMTILYYTWKIDNHDRPS